MRPALARLWAALKNFLDRPQSVFARRALFQVHLWVGVVTGFYIFVVCATGAALVFRIDMQRAMHPALFTPRAPGPLADPVDVMESVRKAYPTATLSGIDAPTSHRVPPTSSMREAATVF